MSKQKPEHIGIIPDGNRRWATGKGMKKQDGYAYGLEPGLKLLQMAKQFKAFQQACVEAVEMLTKEEDSSRAVVLLLSFCAVIEKLY